MYNYITEFCDKFEYPVEAKQTLLKAYEGIRMQKEAKELFEYHVDLYFKDQLEDYNQAWSDLEKAAELSDVHKYTVHLLFLIILSKHLRERYEERGIAYKIFYDSMCDLKWKLFECHKMYDIWGSFVSDWEKGFFTMDLFALGRLQFELIPSPYSYEKDGYQVKKGDTVINMHIPSCGPLRYEDCLASYREAAKFFGEHFPKMPIPFVCFSWLLYPQNKEILPEGSNIRKFINDFTIVATTIDEDGSDLWRIFYRDYKNKPEDLPRDTSLQRAYADWLLEGKKFGTGEGIFFFDGERIL